MSDEKFHIYSNASDLDIRKSDWDIYIDSEEYTKNLFKKLREYYPEDK